MKSKGKIQTPGRGKVRLCVQARTWWPVITNSLSLEQRELQTKSPHGSCHSGIITKGRRKNMGEPLIMFLHLSLLPGGKLMIVILMCTDFLFFFFFLLGETAATFLMLLLTIFFYNKGNNFRSQGHEIRRQKDDIVYIK